MKKYRVELNEDERAALQKLIRGGRRGKHSARRLTRARILLLADAGASDTKIIASVGVSLETVEKMRRRFWASRLGALDERPRAGRPRGGKRNKIFDENNPASAGDITRDELVAAIRKLDPNVVEGTQTFKTALFMLAALYLGHSDLDKLAEFTGVGRDYIEPRAKRLREQGVWVEGNRTACSWWKHDGAFAFWMDVNVAEGFMGRVA